METILFDDFDREVTCEYRGESYRVRDNGSVLRQHKLNGRKRRLDNEWTFGRPEKNTGYLSIASVRVHIIVATAFLGPKPSKSHVVDHIDTNRKNNRPENLRWVTRLENILLNPITARRIEIAYGSIEEFFANPNKPKSSKLDQNFEWMRSVTKEEAEQARKSLQHWAESQGQPSGGSLGEWIFRPRHRELDAFYEQKAEKQSESVSKLNEIKEKVTKTNLDRPPVRMAVVFRGMARHVDYCPLEMRIWKGKPYANFIDDCLYSPCCASSEDGYVYCIGGRSITSQDEYEAWKKKVEMKA